MRAWYEKAVFYHIYPLGLLGAPKENFSPDKEPVCPAPLRNLEPWIPHMKELGCNALYIGPLFESSTHGYDTRDYRLVDRRLGTNEDFRRFVKLCHEAGIQVVVDGVFNHTGREFFAFRSLQENREDSPYSSWYRNVQFHTGSPLGDSFCYDCWQGHFSLPCLNLSNPEVKTYLFDTVRFWIEQFDIDGIRLDCANVLDMSFMQELREKTAAMKPEFWLMGEVIHGEYGRWVNLQTLHSVTNYELHKALYSGHNDHNYFEIAHNVRRLEAVGTALYTFTDNHDEDRLYSKLHCKAHLFPVYQLLFTLPGIPSIYYGSEWGIEGKRSSCSDEALRPALSLEQMENNELTEYISSLAAIHRENDAFHGGRYQELFLTNRQYAFCRFGSETVVLSAVNNDEQEAAVSVSLPFSVKEAEFLLQSPGNPISRNPAAGEAERTGVFCLQDRHLGLTLPPNGGIVLRLFPVS